MCIINIRFQDYVAGAHLIVLSNRYELLEVRICKRLIPSLVLVQEWHL